MKELITNEDAKKNDTAQYSVNKLNRFSAIPATFNDAEFVMTVYNQNIDILHGIEMELNEWISILLQNDEDEQNLLILKDAIPCGWLRVNGLLNKDMAWISMLVVSDTMQRKGVGGYAVSYAEKIAKSKGFNKIGIHTTKDNIPAQSLYKKCGYTITELGECTTADGLGRNGCTFEKALS